MKIAKIVSSNSHIDYVGRVIDELDRDDPPKTTDYEFGQFVGVVMGSDQVIGVIYDSKLVNPEYASFGPRLSPRPQASSFTPDFINEQGTLIGILLLGVVDSDGHVLHGVPRQVVPPGQDVANVDDETMRRFHTGEDGQIRFHYYSQIVRHAGPFALPLLDTIIDALARDCSETDRQRLDVLKQTLKWQGTIGGVKL